MSSRREPPPPPPFIFRVDEIKENPRSRPLYTNEGQWIPSHRRGDNVSAGGGASGYWWLFHQRGIQQLSIQPPPDAHHYQTFSVYFSEGFGFWILRGDATNPPRPEGWHPLWFDNEANDHSSYLTNAGTSSTLRYQLPTQDWTNMLLPRQYHNTVASRRVALTGDIAIFLSLLALSMHPQYMTQQIPRQFQSGSWARHQLPHGRIDRRGVVVYVYKCPESWATVYGRSTNKTLHDYELGLYGKYFE